MAGERGAEGRNAAIGRAGVGHPHGRAGLGPAADISDADMLDYMADMLSEMEMIAERGRFGTLAALLGLAGTEAMRRRADLRKAAGAAPGAAPGAAGPHQVSGKASGDSETS